MKWRARSMRCALGMPTSSSGKPTLSVTVRQGNVDSSWNTMPIDLCGPEIVSPATETMPSCWPSRPPMTLKSVDLPHPDGPMTDRNSPGWTLSETLSTAVIGPSGVSKRTMMSFATRMASLTDASDGIAALLALARHRRGRGGGVAGLDAHVDDGNRAGLDRGNGLRKRGREIGDGGHRTEALRALRARHGCEIDVGLGNALPDPAVLDGTIAHAGDAFLMQFVVEERAIIGDDDEQRNAVMRRCPERRHAHQEIAVAADSDREAAAVFQCERRTD